MPADQGTTLESVGTGSELPSPLVTVTSTVSLACVERPVVNRLAFSVAADEPDTRLTVAFQVLPEARLVTSPRHFLFPDPRISTLSRSLTFVPVTVPGLFCPIPLCNVGKLAELRSGRAMVILQ